MKSNFKERYSLEKRSKDAQEILKNYPDRVPIIIEKRKSSSWKKNESKLTDLQNSKYLVPKDLTIGQFFFIIREKIHVRQEDALYFFINNKIPMLSATLGSIYKDYQDEDKFLYIEYSEEATFG